MHSFQDNCDVPPKGPAAGFASHEETWCCSCCRDSLHSSHDLVAVEKARNRLIEDTHDTCPSHSTVGELSPGFLVGLTVRFAPRSEGRAPAAIRRRALHQVARSHGGACRIFEKACPDFRESVPRKGDLDATRRAFSHHLLAHLDGVASGRSQHVISIDECGFAERLKPVYGRLWCMEAAGRGRPAPFCRSPKAPALVNAAS